MSIARDEKHQQTKIYNEDQSQNAWNKFDQKIKEKEDKSHQKISSKKLLGAQDDSICEIMCWRLLKQQSAPEIEINVFDRNPMEFHYFMAVFKEVAQKRVDDEQGKLTYLIKYKKRRC